MLLVIDVGNTNLVFGIYDKDELKFCWRMSTEVNRTSNEIGMFIVNHLNFENIKINDIEGIIVSSVVPPIMYSLENAIKKYLNQEPIVINSTMDFGIRIMYDNPREAGIDRIVNVVAAYNIYGSPIIVVDFGTATTLSAINGKGEYLGGTISPGIKISSEALFARAAKLPRIELIKPKKVIGTNTINNMQSGIVNGYIGQINHLIDSVKDEMNEKDIKVIATGGMAQLIAKECPEIDEINAFLTLEGLKIIYNKFKNQ
jgi:type III pantothenate kinase